MAIGQHDWGTIVKLQLMYNFVISALYGMGTERHFDDIQRLMRKEVTAEVAQNNSLFSCIFLHI